MRKRLLFFALLLMTFVFSALPGFTQPVNLNLVKGWQDDVGTSVLGMSQDPQGFLWLATKNGLYKYNGYQYTSYHNEPLNSNSPAAAYLECVAADNAGYIWFAPRCTGLDRLDASTGIFTHFRHNKNDPGSLANDTVSVILQDRHGTIWIGTDKGLDRFDSKTNKFIHYDNVENDPSSLSCNIVRVIYEDKRGTLWVGTGSPFQGENPGYAENGGLNKLDRQTAKFTRYMHDGKDVHSLIDNRVGAIFEDSRNNFWVGTAGDGLHTMDRTTGVFERHLSDRSQPDKLSRTPLKNNLTYAVDFISFIKEDNAGKIWIGTFENGINVYDPSTHKTSGIGCHKDGKECCGEPGFWTAYKTTDHVLWISSWGTNLYKIDPYRNVLPHTRTGKIVYAVCEDDANTLWLGTSKGLLHKDITGKEERFLIDRDSSALFNTIGFIEREGTRLWILSPFGLYLFDPVTKGFSGYHHQQGNTNSLSSDTPLIMKKGIANALWIGGPNGLDRMDTRSGAFTHFRHRTEDPSSLSSNQVYEITIDKKRNVWVGTYEGINKLDERTGRFKSYLGQLVINGITEDSGENLWCSTSAGLFRYDNEQDKFVNFSDETGIITSSLEGSVIAEDHEQNLWLGTAKGLICINKQRNAVTLFGKNQGVNGLALTFCNSLLRNGDLLLGDTSGYFAIKPGQSQANGSPPIVTINSFLLNNVPVQPADNGILSAPLAQTKSVRLGHDQNTFSFEFSNIDFISDHADTRLLYTLQNYDNTWHKAGDEKTAYYFNLPPGKYVFKVKAINAAGISAEKDVSVVITPPWWNTWWAYSLFVIAIAGIVYAFYRNRISQLHKKQAAQINVMVAAQEGERKRISRDLHDDVGTKLSALKLFLSSLQEKAVIINNEEIRSLAGSSEQFITEVMHDVRQLLLNLSPAVLEEFGYTMAVEGLVNKINETNQLHFSLVIFGMKQQLRKDYELALYRITQELINNVLKHAEAKNVALQIGHRDERIILMIEDDGKGFNVHAHKDGYGLNNLEARTKLMHGAMVIDSQSGKGTSVLIEIPYSFN